MTISLPSLISSVRDNLSDLPEDFIDDVQIQRDLEKAQTYIEKIADTEDIDEDYLKETIISLATFYSYVNYTSLVENRLGNIPVATRIKLDVLRSIALAYLKPIANVKINDDLTVDQNSMNVGGLAYGNTGTVLEDLQW